MEVILLLRDALQPESFIPTSWEPSAPAEQPKKSSPTPLEDHVGGQSPLERSAESRRRIEEMEVDTSRRTGAARCLGYNLYIIQGGQAAYQQLGV